MPRPLTILCLASYYKGNRFLEEARRQGGKVLLLTLDNLVGCAWPRESLDAVISVPGEILQEQDVLDAVQRLIQTHSIDRVVGLDEYDIELAARLRRHLRLPGMSETTARGFRDKLRMRQLAHDGGILVPRFVHALEPAEVARFLGEVPGPWLLKPRRDSGSVGIQPLQRAEEAAPLLDALGDRREDHLIEQMIPGDLYHVDALTSEHEVVFAETHRYHRSLLQVVREGGIFGTHTLPRGGDEERGLRAVHDPLLSLFGLVRGASHTEFIRGRDDGRFYLLETSARVGGGHISELVEASTGLNLWEQWARLELAQGEWPYRLPPVARRYGGVVNSLSWQARPDTQAYEDPEIWSRVTDPYRAGFILCADSHEQLMVLIERYESRIARDFLSGPLLTLRTLAEAQATKAAETPTQG